MASRGRGRRGRPRGIIQASSAFDRQAFVEAIWIAVAAITQTCAIVSQGGLNNLQRLEAHRPSMVRGGVDSRVRTTMTIEGEVDVIRGIQDMGAGTKRKGDQPSSSSGKKQKASGSQGFQSPIIRAKDKLGLRDGQDRCYVSTASGLDI